MKSISTITACSGMGSKEREKESAPNLVTMNRVTVIDLSKGPLNVWVSRPIEIVHDSTNRMTFTVTRDFQLYHVVAGKIALTINEKRMIAGAGDTIILSPRDRVTMEVEEEATYHHCHFTIRHAMGNAIYERLSEWARVVAYAGHHGARYHASLYLPDVIKLEDSTGVTRRLEAIRQLHGSANPGSEIAAKAHLLLLLQEISASVFEVLLKSHSKVRFVKSNKHITRAVDYIARNIGGDLSVLYR